MPFRKRNYILFRIFVILLSARSVLDKRRMSLLDLVYGRGRTDKESFVIYISKPFQDKNLAFSENFDYFFTYLGPTFNHI